jgi:hypothetical protein
MSEIGTKSDHPQVALDVLKAARVAVPAQQSVLTLSANSCPLLANIERQVHSVNGHTGIACDLHLTNPLQLREDRRGRAQRSHVRSLDLLGGRLVIFSPVLSNGQHEEEYQTRC